MSTIVLLAHGSRDPRWIESIAQVKTRLAEQQPSARIELAFLEFHAPDLETLAETLVAAGVETAWVMPLFIAAGGHVLNDLPRLLVDLEKRHPALKLELGPVVGALPTVQEAMADAIASHISSEWIR